MLFANISSDRIFFVQGEQKWELPFGDLEKYLPEFLHTMQGKLLPEDGNVKIVVLNGPGSFTNLRIATLACNTFSMLHDFSRDFFPVNKLEWYTQLYKHGVVKRYCVMYIGQRKNFRVVDCKALAEGGDVSAVSKKFSLTTLGEYVGSLGDDVFLDEVVEDSKDSLLKLFPDMRMYHYREADLKLIALPTPVKMLEPEYMIEANVQNN